MIKMKSSYIYTRQYILEQFSTTTVNAKCSEEGVNLTTET